MITLKSVLQLPGAVAKKCVPISHLDTKHGRIGFSLRISQLTCKRIISGYKIEMFFDKWIINHQGVGPPNAAHLPRSDALSRLLLRNADHGLPGCTCLAWRRHWSLQETEQVYWKLFVWHRGCDCVTDSNQAWACHWSVNILGFSDGLFKQSAGLLTTPDSPLCAKRLKLQISDWRESECSL